jgi:guanosine-3',5'-bis(diphosphate) 3'-pyrophosphohydrolase
MILEAAAFAARKHSTQRRKDVGASPYINHPIEVAGILAGAGIEEANILAAALLHDTLEDTDTSSSELEAVFGAEVREIVEAVTDDKALAKEERKRRQIAHAAHLSSAATLVKLADKIANVRDIGDNPPAGWDEAQCREYLDWAEAVVRNCPPGSPALREEFDRVLELARQRLSMARA